MKRVLLPALALALLLPSLAGAKKKAKQAKAHIDPQTTMSTAGAVTRSMCGFELGMILQGPESRNLRDVTDLYKRMLPEGDRMFSVQKGMEAGSTGCLLQVFGDNVWRVQATFPPAYTKAHPWDAVVKETTENLGAPQKTEQNGDKADRLKLVWKDDKTRFAATKEVRGKDSGLDDERGSVFYLYAIEDIALSMRQVKAKGE